MVNRRYELPGIQDISKEQDAALALPSKGRHLIVGGPGTGKSVLTLLRARRHQRDGDAYLFLVYNHLLHQASVQLFGSTLDSATWESWFRQLFFEITGRQIPTVEPKGENDFQAISWRGVEDQIDAMQSIPNFERPFLVVDEGQDMPPQFYGSLVNLGFENFFVVADQNQQITEANSSRTDIANALDIDTDDIIELKVNYRNSWPVARLARAFYTGDFAAPPPELPPKTRASAPMLYTYEDGNLERVAAGILRLADRDTRTLIGVLAPSNVVRQRYYDALRSVDVLLDNPKPAIHTFHRNHRQEIAFHQGGILVINAQACKGLEFDTVVLADIDEHYFRISDPDPTKRLFYVMAARARERVILLTSRGSTKLQRLDTILPSNPEVLQRREL